MLHLAKRERTLRAQEIYFFTERNLFHFQFGYYVYFSFIHFNCSYFKYYLPNFYRVAHWLFSSLEYTGIIFGFSPKPNTGIVGKCYCQNIWCSGGHLHIWHPSVPSLRCEGKSKQCMLHTILCLRNSIYARKRSHAVEALGSLTTKDFVDRQAECAKAFRLLVTRNFHTRGIINLEHCFIPKWSNIWNRNSQSFRIQQLADHAAFLLFVHPNISFGFDSVVSQL